MNKFPQSEEWWFCKIAETAIFKTLEVIFLIIESAHLLSQSFDWLAQHGYTNILA